MSAVKKEKPYSCFGKDKSTKSGLYCYCKDCAAIKRKKYAGEQRRQWTNEWRSRNVEHVRQRSRERYAANLDRGRAIQRRYREKNRDLVLQRGRNRKMRIRQYVAEYKASYGCIDCGEKDATVLDLHHRNRSDKLMAVSQLLNKASFDSVIVEMGKCYVVCANCHRRRHANGVEHNQRN